MPSAQSTASTAFSLGCIPSPFFIFNLLRQSLPKLPGWTSICCPSASAPRMLGIQVFLTTSSSIFPSTLPNAPASWVFPVWLVWTDTFSGPVSFESYELSVPSLRKFPHMQMLVSTQCSRESLCRALMFFYAASSCHLYPLNCSVQRISGHLNSIYSTWGTCQVPSWVLQPEKSLKTMSHTNHRNIYLLTLFTKWVCEFLTRETPSCPFCFWDDT